MPPATLLAIDPGTNSGWAAFSSDGQLLGCGLGAVPNLFAFPKKVIIECPRLRPRGEKNPNSILLVARSAGEWGGMYGACGAKVVYISPNDWKGSTPKQVSHQRVLAKLTDQESKVLQNAFLSHPGRKGMAPKLRENVLDAVGIGLYGVGR